MSIDLSPEHREFVREELESGHFSSEAELIAEAIELLRARQSVLAKLDVGVSQLERGEGHEFGSGDRERFIAHVLGGQATADTTEP